MFCNNCGNKLEDGAKFCNNCGVQQKVASQVAEEAPQYATQEETVQYNQPVSGQAVPQYQGCVPYNTNQNPQPPVNATKKSSSGCIIAIIVAVVLGIIFVAGIVIFALIGFNTAKDVEEENISVINELSDLEELFDDSDTTDKTPSAEYSAIFSDNNIVTAPYLFVGLSSRAFACADEEGIVENMEFGYEGDTIKELVDTIYYPISEYDDSYIEILDETMRDTFSVAEEIDCCTVTYEITNNYYIIKIHSTDLDKATNLYSLSEAGVITYDGFATYLSIDETATGLASQGFVER